MIHYQNQVCFGRWPRRGRTSLANHARSHSFGTFVTTKVVNTVASAKATEVEATNGLAEVTKDTTVLGLALGSPQLQSLCLCFTASPTDYDWKLHVVLVDYDGDFNEVDNSKNNIHGFDNY